MKFIIENWYILFTILVLVLAAIYSVFVFLKKPNKEKIKNLKEYLKYAVSIAEKDLGSGTGQLKLRKVYSMAIEKFPWIATIYSFDKFSEDVDNALEWMNNQLETNPAFEDYIES